MAYQYSLTMFYNSIGFHAANCPKFFEYCKGLDNKAKVRHAVRFANDLWEKGAPEQAVYLGVVKEYLKHMGGDPAGTV
jgi:hypothetical protein